MAHLVGEDSVWAAIRSSGDTDFWDWQSLLLESVDDLSECVLCKEPC